MTVSVVFGQVVSFGRLNLALFVKIILTVTVVFSQVVSFGRLNLALISATHLSHSDWVGQVYFDCNSCI